MPKDAVSRTANVERKGGHKWVNLTAFYDQSAEMTLRLSMFKTFIAMSYLYCLKKIRIIMEMG